MGVEADFGFHLGRAAGEFEDRPQAESIMLDALPFPQLRHRHTHKIRICQSRCGGRNACPRLVGARAPVRVSGYPAIPLEGAQGVRIRIDSALSESGGYARRGQLAIPITGAATFCFYC